LDSGCEEAAPASASHRQLTAALLPMQLMLSLRTLLPAYSFNKAQLLKFPQQTVEVCDDINRFFDFHFGSPCSPLFF